MYCCDSDLEVYTEASLNWLWKKLQRWDPLHRARHINNHINTCTHISLHIINLTDWHVRQPLGRPLSVCLASRLARGYKCQQVRCGVVIFMLWKKNIVQMRSPLSGSLCPSCWAVANTLNWFTTENHYRPYFDDLFVWHGGINLFNPNMLYRQLCILIWCCWYLHLVQRIIYHPCTNV